MTSDTHTGSDNARRDLAERCQEVLDWHRTGLLSGDRLRALADTLTDHIQDHQRLHIAEDKTAAEAMKFVIDHVGTPAQGVDQIPDDAKRLTGATLGAWCYANPNQAARTIELLRHDVSPAAIEPDRDEIISMIEQRSFDIIEPFYHKQRLAKAAQLYDAILSKFKVTSK